MNATEKLIKLYQEDPLLKGITLTTKNIKSAVFYVEELHNCKKCKGLEYCKNSICGIRPKFDGENISYEPCEYKVIEERKYNVDTTFASNYVMDASLASFELDNPSRLKVYEYANKVLSSVKKMLPGLYIYGQYGTGKTYFLSALANELAQKGIKVTVKNESSAISPFILNTLFFIGMLFLFYWFMGRKMGGSSGPFGMGKSRAKMLNGKEDTRKVTFDNVAGIDEAKEEVQEIVEFLKEPAAFQKLGGRIPKGVLLVGPPGTGKTLLARAIAGEAQVPFFAISGSDFEEMFVGVGASRRG